MSTPVRDFAIQLGAMTGMQSMASVTVLAVPVLAPPIAAAVGTSPANIGLYTALLYGAGMFSGLIGGGVVPRWGALRVCQVCLLLCAAGVLLATTGAAGALLLAALVVGAGAGAPTPASSHVMLQVTPPGYTNLVMSIKQTGVPIGGAIAGAVLPTLAEHLGWRGALALVAVGAVATAAALSPWRAALDGDRDPTRRLDLRSAWRPLGLIWRDGHLRRIGLASAVISAVQLCLAAVYVTYLTEVVGLSLASAGFALGTAQVAGVAGRILWGALADRIGARPVLIVIAAGVVLSAALVAAFTPAWPLLAIHAVSAAFGATALGWNGVAFAEVARLAPPGRAAEATGGIMFFAFGGIVLGPALFTALVGATGSYPLGYAVASAAAALVLGSFVWAAVRQPAIK